MSITPTTPRDPSPSQLSEAPGLYDASHWETAYRHFDEDAVPALLLHLQDDLTRARRREAAWLSVIVHLLVIILFVNQPRLEGFYRRVFLHQQPIIRVSVQDLIKQKELTYLELPPDVQKITRRPDTNVISDKDRIASSRTPQLDARELKKIIDSSRPGRPGPSGAQAEQPPQTASSAPPSPGPQGQAQDQAPPPQNQLSQLQPPPIEKPPPIKFGGGMSAGSAIEQAARAASQNRGGYGGDGGDFGLNQGKAGTVGPLEVLTDTMGVDFNPYLSRVLHDVKQHWYELIPESAEMKRGKVVLEFAILKDGSVAGLKYDAGSGDIALDRAAYGSITGSNPFPPLPKEFTGPYLGLRFSYYYNIETDSTGLR
ncbi:MAG: TonB family protein [Terriglobales bacterium]